LVGLLALQLLAAFTPTAEPVRLALADRPVATLGPRAEFLAHKTTRREVYAFANAT
jgi:para-aminobenzoate synthetase/4-amino-4-deoxychorismate lyase